MADGNPRSAIVAAAAAATTAAVAAADDTATDDKRAGYGGGGAGRRRLRRSLNPLVVADPSPNRASYVRRSHRQPIIVLEAYGYTSRTMWTRLISNKNRLKTRRRRAETLSDSVSFCYCHPGATLANQSPNKSARLLAIRTRPCIWIKDGLKALSDAFPKNTI